MSQHLPRYPVYIPSKGRHDQCLTGNFLAEDGVPFHVVVEPQEQEKYKSEFGAERVLVLPFSNLGQGSIPARNWIKDHSTSLGFARHWQLDDNIRCIRRLYKKQRVRCSAGVALAVCEDFTDRYENVAVSGLNYSMFGIASGIIGNIPPFYRNTRVYSCSLVLNALPYGWRGRYNEDTDLCLQVIADGWCTISLNAFLIEKVATMTMKGGNAAQLYKADGRLKMARSLERVWPGVVRVDRRFKRPQHVVHSSWRKFDTQLKLKPGIKLEDMRPNEYGMILKENTK
jgi:hypothetical protein